MTFQPGDIFRLKTPDGKAIGGYYVVTSSEQDGVYAYKMRNGVEEVGESQFYFSKDRIIVEKTARFKTDEQTMKAINAPGFQANLSFPLGRYEDLYKQFKEDNIKVFRFSSVKAGHAYVTFTEVLKVLRHNGDKEVALINVRKVD